MVTEMLAGAGWGWHIETAVHVIRIILGGVFDRYPKLQIVIGHMGEGLPFMLQRFDIMPPAVTKLKRPSATICGRNVHYTFSGFNFPADLPRSAARSRRRPHHVLGRSPYRLDGRGARLPRPDSGQRRRPRAHRARQRGEAVQAVGWVARLSSLARRSIQQSSVVDVAARMAGSDPSR